MLQQILIMLGAGVVSAVFFFIPVKGSILALLLGVFAPLPLMIVALGYGLRSAAISTLVGALLVTVVLDAWLALAFIFSAALPALLLAFLFVAARPADAGSPQAPYAVGNVLVGILVVTILLDFAGIFAIGFRYPSFDAAVDDLATRFTPIVEAVLARTNGLPGDTSAKDFAGALVLAMGPVMAIWGVFALAINSWLAARVVYISHGLDRPWPDIPASAVLPRGMLVAFAIIAALTLMSGALRVFAMTAAAAIGAGMALQGLAIVHFRTRGNPARVGILTGVYGASMFLFPWPLLLLAALGFADLALSNRLRHPQPPVAT